MTRRTLLLPLLLTTLCLLAGAAALAKVDPTVMEKVSVELAK